jgi:hypothetical protein
VPIIERAAGRAGRILAAAFALAVAVPVLLAACSTATPDTSFDPASPCTGDGQFAGAYPALEGELPGSLDGAEPTSVDSGRNCSDRALGTLAAHDLREVRFAGALWEVGQKSGVRIAVFDAPGLTTDWMAEFYEAGARSARRTDQIRTGPFDAGGATGRRLDAFVDTTYQSVVVLDGPRPGLVRAVLVATDLGEAESRAAHNDLVARAVAASLAAGTAGA